MLVVGIQIAELWSSIASFKTELSTLEERQSVEKGELNLKHKEELAELKAKSENVKKEFASYLKEAGINIFLAPAKKKKISTTVKLLTVSKSKKAFIERNKAIYTSSYEKGINDKTGLPNKHKGRGNKNQEITRLMKNDEEAFKKSNK